MRPRRDGGRLTERATVGGAKAALSVRRCQMGEKHFAMLGRPTATSRRPPPRSASFDFIGGILRAALRVIRVYNSVNESAIWQTAISFKTDREG